MQVPFATPHSINHNALSGSSTGSNAFTIEPASMTRADTPISTKSELSLEDKSSSADGTKHNGDHVIISAEGRSKSLQETQGRERAAELDEDALRELSARDLEVRAHEQAHSSVGGELTGAASYSFAQGPDGVRYAVAGEVSIDVSDVPGDPQATIDKMTRVRRAALAPAEPSAQDRQVAAMAMQKMTDAQADLANEQREALQADAQLREDKRDEFNSELEQARSAEKTTDATEESEENVFVSVAEEFAEYNARLRQINETLLRISVPDLPLAGSLLDDIA